MRQESWSEQNRDRLLFVAGLIVAAAAAVWLVRGWRPVKDWGHPTAPSSAANVEQLGDRFVSSSFGTDWSKAARDPFHAGAGVVVAPAEAIDLPPVPPPIVPIPRPITGPLPAPQVIEPSGTK